MVRTQKIDEYGQQVTNAMNELLKLCSENMAHFGDLLICHQNGSMFDDRPILGLGKEGVEYIPRLNAITGKGIGDTTNDNDYFTKNGNDYFDGTSELELSIVNELKKYQDIWENNFFLRLLTQLVHLLNGEHYDWNLYIDRNKGNHIENQIIKKCVKAPLFHEVISCAYDRKVRNAAAHSQYQLVQGGILLNNIEEKDSLRQGLTFEQWEKIYIQSYCLLIYTKKALELMTSRYFERSKMTGGGIPVIVPAEDGTWRASCLYPDKTGSKWRFVRTDF